MLPIFDPDGDVLEMEPMDASFFKIAYEEKEHLKQTPGVCNNILVLPSCWQFTTFEAHNHANVRRIVLLCESVDELWSE